MANTLRKSPLLFTPGPLTTSLDTKKSMLVDMGSWDDDFNKVTSVIRSKVLKVVNGNKSYTCVPLQGSGSFGIEAMIINFISKKDKILILINGSYGERIRKICDYHKIKNIPFVWKENEELDIKKLQKKLQSDKSIKNLAFVHCETSTGIINPINKVNNLCKKLNVNLFIDAMSTFGALTIDSNKIKFKALVASSNKCIEGVPGISFCISRTNDLIKSKGNSDNLCMDLYDQWKYMEATGQWRFTPPTHTILGFLSALNQHASEGGVLRRLNRYETNKNILIEGMRELGFETLLSDKWISPIIVSFLYPADENFNFEYVKSTLPPSGLMAVKDESFFKTTTMDITGKTILIYTDGVTEGYVDEGKELEVAGLEQEIKTLNTTSPEIIINHATKILTEKGFTLRDDITALGIKL